jgi:hypothetical protein
MPLATHQVNEDAIVRAHCWPALSRNSKQVEMASIRHAAARDGQSTPSVMIWSG